MAATDEGMQATCSDDSSLMSNAQTETRSGLGVDNLIQTPHWQQFRNDRNTSWKLSAVTTVGQIN
jgi:hypothetical protein